MANTLPQNTQKVAAMASAIVAQDPILRHKLRRLVDGVIDHMAYTMAHGSGQEKQVLVKSITPHLLSGLQSANQSEKKIEEAATYQRMLAYMRGEITLDDFNEQQAATLRKAG